MSTLNISSSASSFTWVSQRRATIYLTSMSTEGGVASEKTGQTHSARSGWFSMTRMSRTLTCEQILKANALVKQKKLKITIGGKMITSKLL
jgi:hypothetical protein